MSEKLYKGYEKLSDIFERHLIYNFDVNMVNFLMGECCQFLQSKEIHYNHYRHFLVEFDIKGDNSYVALKGANLMSTLWLIDVYPPNPEKFIIENTCIFDGKKYIYDPRGKSLKIVKYATKQR